MKTVALLAYIIKICLQQILFVKTSRHAKIQAKKTQQNNSYLTQNKLTMMVSLTERKQEIMKFFLFSGEGNML